MWRAALVVAVEGLALLGLAAFLIVELVVSTPSDVGGAVGILLFTAAGGAGLLVLARSLAGAARWARGPTVVMQLVAVPVGYTLTFQSGQPYWGIPVLGLAAAELYLLATPEARLVFDDRD